MMIAVFYGGNGGKKYLSTVYASEGRNGYERLPFFYLFFYTNVSYTNTYGNPNNREISSQLNGAS